MLLTDPKLSVPELVQVFHPFDISRMERVVAIAIDNMQYELRDKLEQVIEYKRKLMNGVNNS